MTTSTQTQLRRGTASQVAAMTPATGEAVVNTTNSRIHVGDGATAGGIPHANAPDIQNQSFIYATVGGTADAITLTNTPSVLAYAAPLKQSFKATGTNTTAVTVNVDGLGTKNVKKLLDGSLVALTAGDIVSGGYYEVIYDGTQFQIKGLGVTTPATGLPTATHQTLSGSAAVVTTVDFTTYYGYQLAIVGMTGPAGHFNIEVSSNAGAGYASETRIYSESSGSSVSAKTNEGDIQGAGVHHASFVVTQGSTTGTTTAQGSFVDTAGQLVRIGATEFATSAAVNRIKVTSAGGNFTGGHIVISPLAKR